MKIKPAKFKISNSDIIRVKKFEECLIYRKIQLPPGVDFLDYVDESGNLNVQAFREALLVALIKEQALKTTTSTTTTSVTTTTSTTTTTTTTSTSTTEELLNNQTLEKAASFLTNDIIDFLSGISSNRKASN